MRLSFLEEADSAFELLVFEGAGEAMFAAVFDLVWELVWDESFCSFEALLAAAATLESLDVGTWMPSEGRERDLRRVLYGMVAVVWKRSRQGVRGRGLTAFEVRLIMLQANSNVCCR